MSRITQIRRAHASARPKASNPAWFHTHNDLTVVLESHDALLAALKGLYADQVDYLTINKLGGMDNHWMKAACAAISKAEGETKCAS